MDSICFKTVIKGEPKHPLVCGVDIFGIWLLFDVVASRFKNLSHLLFEQL